jgi:antitoxin component of MazEF toxin-antitoxin module
MVKHLTTHGNSLALVIEKGVLELLGISRKTSLRVTTDGSSLIISPLKDTQREKRFKEALKEINRRHSKTLKALAE